VRHGIQKVSSRRKRERQKERKRERKYVDKIVEKRKVVASEEKEIERTLESDVVPLIQAV